MTILDRPTVEVTHLPEGADLVSELRRFDHGAHKYAYGWTIQAEVQEDDEIVFPALTIALHGDTGAICYRSGGILLRPVSGNGKGLLYVHVGRETSKPNRTVPGSEVSAETVYRAVGEFVHKPGPPDFLKWVAPTFVVERKGNSRR